MRIGACLVAAATGMALLTGCGDGSTAPASTPSTTSGSSASAGESTSDPSATTAETTTPAASPSEQSPYPDPADLIGKEIYFEAAPSEAVVVDGERIEGVKDIFGSCFGATESDACPFAVAAVQPADDAGTPQASTTALVLLLASTGRDVDGSVVWTTIDAEVVELETAALLEPCVGHDGVAIAPSGISGGTVTVSRAWGPDDARATIVTVDPASLSCEALGD